MATKKYQKLIYRTNRAFEASQQGDRAAVARYADALRDLDEDTPLVCGYRLYLEALSQNVGDGRRELFDRAYACFLESNALDAAAVVMLDAGRECPAGPNALKSIRRALELFRTSKNGVGEAKALTTLGVAHMELQEFDEAALALREAVRLARRVGDVHGLGIASLNLAGCLLYLGDNASALHASQESVACLEEARNLGLGPLIWQTNGWRRVDATGTGFVADAYVNYGNALDVLGQYEEAVEAFTKARSLIERRGDALGQAVVLNQIGHALLSMGNAEAAEEHFLASVALFEKQDDPGPLYPIAIQSLGEAYAAQGRESEALEQYDRGLVEFEKRGDRMRIAEALLLKAEVHARRGEYPMAVALLERSLEIGQTISAIEIVVRCNRMLGSVVMNDDAVRASDFLQCALLLAEEHDMKTEQLFIRNELKMYCKLIGDQTGALIHLEHYHALHKEIHTERAAQRLRALEVMHRVDQYRKSLHDMAERVELVERELAEKTRELAEVAERIMEKQEFLALVERGLKRLIAAHSDRKEDHARRLLDEIQSAGNIKGEWEALTEKFLSMHREFAERLMQIAPGLTTTEFRVCVLLRLSMSAKQIADVMKIAPKTVFNHQQSIREKLRLVGRVNLKSHLLRLECSDPDWDVLPANGS